LREAGSTETRKDFCEREATSYLVVVEEDRYWGGRSATKTNFHDARVRKDSLLTNVSCEEVMMQDSEVIQWLFDCEAISRGFNFPVSVGRLVAAKRGIDAAVAGKAPAADVAAKYEKFAGAIGPTVMNALLESDDAFFEVNHSDNLPVTPAGKVCLYVDSFGVRVLATPTKQWGLSPTFNVE
jgi:hypothetical protein